MVSSDAAEPAGGPGGNRRAKTTVARRLARAGAELPGARRPTGVASAAAALSRRTCGNGRGAIMIGDLMTWSLTAVPPRVNPPARECRDAGRVAAASTGRTRAVTRGITGRIVVESEHGFVRGRPDLDLESPILVRVAKSRSDRREIHSPSWSSSARTSENSTSGKCWSSTTAVRSIAWAADDRNRLEPLDRCAERRLSRRSAASQHRWRVSGLARGRSPSPGCWFRSWW